MLSIVNASAFLEDSNLGLGAVPHRFTGRIAFISSPPPPMPWALFSWTEPAASWRGEGAKGSNTWNWTMSKSPRRRVTKGNYRRRAKPLIVSRRSLRKSGQALGPIGQEKWGDRQKRQRKMAGVAGLEPVTSAVTGQRSNQLSYTPAKGGRKYGKRSQKVKGGFWEFSAGSLPPPPLSPGPAPAGRGYREAGPQGL